MISTLTVKEIPKEFFKRDNIVEDYCMPTIIQTNLSIPIINVRLDSEESRKSLRSLRKVAEKEKREENRAFYLANQSVFV